jgi:Flp pilus assembly protein TadG
MTLGGVDIHRASTVRVNLQDALDAATLAAARSPYTTNAEVTAVGMATLRANLKAYPEITLREDQTTFILNGSGVVVADSKVDVKTIVANIFLPPYGKFMDDKLPVGAHSEVNRSSKNLEVALVLDITGSMTGSRITDLKAASRDLVSIVVKDLQTPYYSKMAIVPYSMGVNLGSYANAARGSAPAARTITNATWATGSSRNISNVTRASPGVVTSSSHGFSSGDVIWISGVRGMTQLNGGPYKVVKINNNSYSLQYRTSGGGWSQLNTTSGAGYSNYSSAGSARKCLRDTCSVQITASNHGFNNGDGVYITDVRGMTSLNNSPYIVSNRAASTFEIDPDAGSTPDDYTSGGSAWCGYDGCEYRVFRNPSNTLMGFANTPCVSERTEAQAYTSASPSTALVGRNYAAPGNDCPSTTIQPLTSNRTTLTNVINGLSIGGSTAGQIGAAWGWYAVSPTFNSLWPSSGAGPHNVRDTLKAVILMTDGEFNTPYCTGVIAQNAGDGSGSASNKINCNATNGDPYTQAQRLCTAMKAEGIVVYTVGFQVASGGDAARFLRDCATGPAYAHLPASGADLSTAFKAIGRDITRLRISK